MNALFMLILLYHARRYFARCSWRTLSPRLRVFSAKNVQNAAFSLDGRQKTLYDDTGSVRVRQVDREASLPSSAWLLV